MEISVCVPLLVRGSGDDPHVSTEFEAIIDIADFRLIESTQWWLSSKKKGEKNRYAVSEYGSMHRLILGVTNRNFVVHHINRNTLDNRRDNLIVCTRKTAAGLRSQQRDKIDFVNDVLSSIDSWGKCADA